MVPCFIAVARMQAGRLKGWGEKTKLENGRSQIFRRYLGFPKHGYLASSYNKKLTMLWLMISVPPKQIACKPSSRSKSWNLHTSTHTKKKKEELGFVSV
jgi:hypothetical protein